MASEIDGGSVAAANYNTDVFAGLRLVAAGQHCCESGGAAGLGSDAQDIPERLLGAEDFFILHEDDAIHEFLREWKHEFANLLRRERVGSDAARSAINGTAGSESVGKRRS
jgi:hypothetical protein